MGVEGDKEVRRRCNEETKKIRMDRRRVKVPLSHSGSLYPLPPLTHTSRSVKGQRKRGWRETVNMASAWLLHGVLSLAARVQRLART